MGLIAEFRSDLRFYRKMNPQKGFIGLLLDRPFLICANYRLGFWACRLTKPVVGTVMRAVYVMTNLIVSTMTGADIRSGAVIGQRFNVHTSFGIMIADGVVIGDDCRIYTGVCVVNKANFRHEGQPRIGNNVTLGVGCKIIGGITVGDSAVVGANAVVLHDVPPYHMAVGVPAQNKPLPQDWAELQAAELAELAT